MFHFGSMRTQPEPVRQVLLQRVYGAAEHLGACPFWARLQLLADPQACSAPCHYPSYALRSSSGAGVTTAGLRPYGMAFRLGAMCKGFYLIYLF